MQCDFQPESSHAEQCTSKVKHGMGWNGVVSTQYQHAAFEESPPIVHIGWLQPEQPFRLHTDHAMPSNAKAKHVMCFIR